MKVLVVDDSRVYRSAIERELAGHYEVRAVGSGGEALAALAQESFDLVTMDVEMAEMTGYEACRKIRALEDDKCNVPVVFITGKDTAEGRADGFKSGATDFMVKPFKEGELRFYVDRILRPKKLFSGMTGLVVERENMVRMLNRRLLEELGLEVLEAQTAAEAESLIRERGQNISVILTSQHLADNLGTHLVREIRTTHGLKDVPIIFVTGDSNKNQIMEIFQAGATDYVLKPYVKEELFGKLKTLLEARRLQMIAETSYRELSRLNSVKDEFVAACSHDLRAPLTGIFGFLDFLKEDASLTDAQKESVHYIGESAAQLRVLVEDLLDLSRIQMTDFELPMAVVEIDKVLQTSVRALEVSALAKKIKLTLETGGQQISLNSNAPALSRIFSNLLTNAIKFTPKGGAVAAMINVGSAQILVKVKDSGIGIPKEKLATLFEEGTKFSRLGTAGEKSTGLGLKIVYKLVRSLGGEITAQSDPKEGTTFSISFPSSALVANPLSWDGAARAVTFRALVVDDEEVTRVLLSRILKQQEFDVVCVGSKAEALEQLKGKHPDLALVDLNLPDGSGVQVAEAIRALEGKSGARRCNVYAFSGQQIEGDRAAQSGFDGAILKPLDMAQIKTLLAGIKKRLLVDGVVSRKAAA